LISFADNKKFNSFNLIYRNCWIYGSNSALHGIITFNNIVKDLHGTTSLTVREIIKWFYIENADLIGLTIGKLVSYLDQENRILYNRKR
jgi:hypothetical protein